MANTTTTTQHLMSCPACGKSIQATFTLSFTLGKVASDKKTVAMEADITGIRVSHDCIPVQVRRGGANQ